MIRLSVISIRAGGYPDGLRAHPLLAETAAKMLRAEHGKRIIDSFTTRAGGRIICIVTSDDKTGSLGDEITAACRKTADEIGLNAGAGYEQVDLLIEERDDEEVLVFLTAGAPPHALTPVLCRTCADHFIMPGLRRDPVTAAGFHLRTETGETFALPAESCALLQAVDEGALITAVVRSDGTPAASAGSGPDPVMILRTGKGFPPTVETLGVAAGEGLLPVSLCDMTPVCKKIACLGFSMAKGMLIGPADLYDDPAFMCQR
ncbi:fructose 1,6-bisphosphatase [Methanofollis fontis]|uniref:Fructose-1,6-bisphosphate aldolase/phosphatase n=1 Tax=Methanofollis fontis TaxID=2052832 RepID=A0A483CTT8_9EURY|nr:fructose 1,6-bisphosphatase [Methanofollis fontis]TAJ44684.1 hypothetical protein CUJ86_05105 [Methanofollis fontis]